MAVGCVTAGNFPNPQPNNFILPNQEINYPAIFHSPTNQPALSSSSREIIPLLFYVQINYPELTRSTRSRANQVRRTAGGVSRLVGVWATTESLNWSGVGLRAIGATAKSLNWQGPRTMVGDHHVAKLDQLNAWHYGPVQICCVVTQWGARATSTPRYCHQPHSTRAGTAVPWSRQRRDMCAFCSPCCQSSRSCEV